MAITRSQVQQYYQTQGTNPSQPKADLTSAIEEEKKRRQAPAGGFNVGKLGGQLVSGVADIARQPSTFFQKSGSTVGSYLGNKTGEALKNTALGDWIRKNVKPEDVDAVKKQLEEQNIFQSESAKPFTSNKEAAGSALTAVANIGTGFIPELKELPLVAKAGILGGQGYAYDVGSKLQENAPLPEAIKPGFGTAIGIALPNAGALKRTVGKAISPVSENMASRIMNSYIKPASRYFEYGKNAGRGVVKEGITANTLDDLTSKVANKTSEIGQNLGNLLSKSKKYATISNYLKPLDTALNEAGKAPETNAALISKLNALKNDITNFSTSNGVSSGYQPVSSVWGLKKFVGGLARFTGNPSDDKLANNALQEIYRNLKKSIVVAEPKAKDLSDRYADLLTAKIALENKLAVNERSNLVKILPKAFSIGSLAFNFNPTGIATSAAIWGGDTLLGSAGFKTRLAKILYNVGTKEKNSIIKSIPILRDYSEAIFGAKSAKEIQQVLDEVKLLPYRASQGTIELPAPGVLAGQQALKETGGITTPATLEASQKAAGIQPKQTLPAIIPGQGATMPMPEKAGSFLTNPPQGQVKSSLDSRIQSLKSTLKNKKQSLIQEAKKYKSAEEFYQKMPSKIRDEFRNNGIKGQEQITNWFDKNITVLPDKPIGEQLSGKIKQVKLKSDTFYHGTSAENARGIMESGFKSGKDLPEETFRGGGYGKIQSSISLAETPKEASIFSKLTKNGEIVEVKLKPNSKVVSIDGIEDAVELENYISYLKKQKVDAVYVGGGEKELVVINPKAIIPTKSQLTDIWNKAHKSKRFSAKVK